MFLESEEVLSAFERSDHSSHLKVCGMFGYVQSKNFWWNGYQM